MTNKSMKKTFSIAEAKTHFSECIQTTLEGNLAIITRYGKPVAALAPVEDLEQLER